MKTYDAYLCGYYGMRNSGDDALLYAAVWGAQNFLNMQKICISTPRNLQIPDLGTAPATLADKQAFRGQHRLQHYFYAARSRQVIFGGGSVLHNETDIKLKMDMIGLSGKPGIAVGVGLGPFANSAAEKSCAEFLKRCEFVGVRDQESFDVAKNLAPDAPVKLTFDLAPQLLCTGSFSLENTPRSGVGINLCPVAFSGQPSASDLQRVKELVETIRMVWNETKERIYLIDINGHPVLGDQHLHQLIMQQLPSHVEVEWVGYDANPIQLLKRLGGLKAIISMRLHGSILGYLAGTPVLSLNYHSKCAGWCEQINMPHAYRLDANKFSADSLGFLLLDGLENGFYSPKLERAQAIRSSLNNWSFCHESATSSIHSCYTAV